MQNICEFHNFGFSPTNLWLESNRTNTSRINNSIICQSDRNALWGIIAHIMTVRSHQRGCTCVCIPVVRSGLRLSKNRRTKTCTSSKFSNTRRLLSLLSSLMSPASLHILLHLLLCSLILEALRKGVVEKTTEFIFDRLRKGRGSNKGFGRRRGGFLILRANTVDFLIPESLLKSPLVNLIKKHEGGAERAVFSWKTSDHSHRMKFILQISKSEGLRMKVTDLLHGLINPDHDRAESPIITFANGEQVQVSIEVHGWLLGDMSSLKTSPDLQGIVLIPLIMSLLTMFHLQLQSSSSLIPLLMVPLQVSTISGLDLVTSHNSPDT